MRQVRILMVLCFVAVSGRSVVAWNDFGHMAVARIAYEQLTDAERNAIVAILRHHPHLHELLLKDCPSHVSEEEWIFVRAATWPDNIRPPRVAHKMPVTAHPIYRFHHATWHYANFEYRAGQLESSLPNRPRPHHPAPANPSDRTDIVEQLDRSYMIVRGTERERSEPEFLLNPEEIRAIRLCWLFHLIGDIHQPLHVTTLVDLRVPSLQSGDEGGNKLAIRIDHASPKQLHAFWDDLIGSHAHYDKVVRTAEMLSHDPRLAPSSLPEFASHKQAWEFADESYRAAKESVYLNGRLHFALWSRRYESHELQAADIPCLTQREVDQAHAIAERRIALAGYRLAERLKFIVSRNGNATGATHGVASPPRRNPAVR